MSTGNDAFGIADAFVAKLDTNGQWLWAVKGGSADGAWAYTLALDSGGNSYIG